MKNALISTETAKQIQTKVKFVIFDRFESTLNTDFDEEGNISLDSSVVKYTKEDNTTQLKNAALRIFFNSENEYCVLWKSDIRLSQQSLERVKDTIGKYIKAIEDTNIPYFTGALKISLKVDYGGQNISIGTGLGQRITIEVIRKDAIESVGYFDVRMTDYSCMIDYVNRLSNKGKMPRIEYKQTPWFFDVESDNKVLEQPEMDEYSSQWYLYKYEDLPWEQSAGNLEHLKEDLKKIKLGK